MKGQEQESIILFWRCYAFMYLKLYLAAFILRKGRHLEEGIKGKKKLVIEKYLVLQDRRKLQNT